MILFLGSRHEKSLVSVFGPINQPNFPLKSCPRGPPHTSQDLRKRERERAAKKSEYEIPFSTAAHPPSHPGRPPPRPHGNTRITLPKSGGGGETAVAAAEIRGLGMTYFPNVSKDARHDRTFCLGAVPIMEVFSTRRITYFVCAIRSGRGAHFVAFGFLFFSGEGRLYLYSGVVPYS